MRASRPSRSSSTARRRSRRSTASRRRSPPTARGLRSSRRRSFRCIRRAAGRGTSRVGTATLGRSTDVSRASRSPIPGPDSDRLAEIARTRGLWLAVGANELERGTIYNSLLIYSPAGELALRHRKLMPTNHERLVWGLGDGTGLETIQTDVGKVGGLICWENLMPLARFALYESGVEIYLAPTADDSEDWHDSIRHIAREARAFVLSSCVFQTASSYPDDVPLAEGDELRRARRLGDPRAGRQLPRRPALGRGGRALRGARPAAPVRGASALRPGRALPPPGRLPVRVAYSGIA